MPYSLVLTNEEQGKFITLVPETWVQGGGYLFWPPADFCEYEIFKLRKNEKSMPGGDWRKLKCQVKVPGVATFADGIKLEKLYSKFDDTEDEEKYFQSRKANRRNPAAKWVLEEALNLNAEFDKMTEEANSNLKQNEDIDMIEANPDPISNNNNIVTMTIDNLNALLAENTSLTTENKNLKESLLKFQNLEQETKRGFAILQVQLDKIFEALNSPKNNQNVQATTVNYDDILAQSKIEFPVKTIEELELLEYELANAEFANALVEKFSSLAGKSGQNKIGKIGLFISKSLFTDNLLHQFTWKGIKGCTKPPFMKYINVRNCFYKIVHLADNSCSASEADTFLQYSAIKHSGQRIKRKSCDLNEHRIKKTKTDTLKKDSLNVADDPCSSNNLSVNTIYAADKEVIVEDPETSNNTNVQFQVWDELNENINTTDKEVIIRIEPETTKKQQHTETKKLEAQDENQNDTDVSPEPRNCSAKSTKITVLSDVKIKNKVMHLKQGTNLVNISSENLLNSELFK